MRSRPNWSESWPPPRNRAHEQYAITSLVKHDGFWLYSGVVSDFPAVNEAYFLKMAYGDLTAFRELARDFFADTRKIMNGWGFLLEHREYARLCEEIHRCKGGASLFGLERVVSTLSRLENPESLAKNGFNLDHFASELDEAESAVKEIAG